MLLALDISTAIGWALFRDARARPKLGTWRAPPAMPGVYGKRYRAAHEWLGEICAVHAPAVLAFEAPVFPRFTEAHTTTEQTLRLLIGLAAMAELVAEERSLRCIEVHWKTAKIALAGFAGAVKRDMISAAVKAGYRVADEHQADACAVGLAAFNHLARA